MSPVSCHSVWQLLAASISIHCTPLGAILANSAQRRLNDELDGAHLLFLCCILQYYNYVCSSYISCILAWWQLAWRTGHVQFRIDHGNWAIVNFMATEPSPIFHYGFSLHMRESITYCMSTNSVHSDFNRSTWSR